MTVVAPRPHSVADVPGFIDLVHAAADTPHIRAALNRLLALPASARHRLLHDWVMDLRAQGAPEVLTRAVACLDDDGVAAQVRAVLASGRSP